jgi:hypothetical protein
MKGMPLNGVLILQADRLRTLCQTPGSGSMACNGEHGTAIFFGVYATSLTKV